MGNKKMLLLPLLGIIIIGVVFYLSNYSQHEGIGTASVLDANNPSTISNDSGIITQNHFQKNSEKYNLVLNDNGEVVER